MKSDTYVWVNPLSALGAGGANPDGSELSTVPTGKPTGAGGVVVVVGAAGVVVVVDGGVVVVGAAGVVVVVDGGVVVVGAAGVVVVVDGGVVVVPSRRSRWETTRVIR